jgi:hypothetical protein
MMFADHILVTFTNMAAVRQDAIVFIILLIIITCQMDNNATNGSVESFELLLKHVDSNRIL